MRHGVRGLALDVRVEARTAVTPASEEVKEARTAVCSRPQGLVHPFSKTTEGLRSHRRVKPMKDAGYFLTRHSEGHLLNGLLTSMRLEMAQQEAISSLHGARSSEHVVTDLIELAYMSAWKRIRQ